MLIGDPIPINPGHGPAWAGWASFAIVAGVCGLTALLVHLLRRRGGRSR